MEKNIDPTILKGVKTENTLFGKIIKAPTFLKLRNSNLDKGFRMAHMRDLAHLLRVCLPDHRNHFENKKYVPLIKELLDPTKDNSIHLTANTITLFNDQHLYVQDNAPGKSNEIRMNSAYIKQQISRHEAGVGFSSNNSMRIVKYPISSISNNPVRIARNPMLIGISGGKQEAEQIAEHCAVNELNPDPNWSPSSTIVDRTKMHGVSIGPGNFPTGFCINAFVPLTHDLSIKGEPLYRYSIEVKDLSE